jgi:mannose-6-phosphate isomerase-like protein (cupin superfamily)
MNSEPSKIRLAELARTLKDRTELKIAEVEDVSIYLTSYLGEYPAHKHPKDEFFYVVEGELNLEFSGKEIVLKEGECYSVNKETVHKPSAKSRTLVLKIEPREFPFEVTER